MPLNFGSPYNCVILHPVEQRFELTPEQQDVILAPVGQPRRVLVEGPAGCGKTTAAVQRLRHLLDVGVRADTIIVWVPQRSLGRPYVDVLRRFDVPAGARVDVLGIDGLARRTLDLFWPVVAGEAGFDPTHEPVFLTLETAQYYMNQILEPYVQGGDFGDVVIARNRLCSQILDNLNKAALVGFPSEEIGVRLSAAWSGPSSRQRVFEAVQSAANDFRGLCTKHNLLDFSMQIQVFTQHLWPRPECRSYLLRRYRHWIADNIEEDIPVAHNLLREAAVEASSALWVYDRDGGFRSYLGADPQGAQALAALCDRRVVLERSFVSSADIQALCTGLSQARSPGKDRVGRRPTHEQIEHVLGSMVEHFNTQLLSSVVDETQRLIADERVPAGEIAILAPFVDDALRFALVNEFQRRRLPVRTHRPSRALRDEPAVRCLLVLAQLAHPHWGMCPPRGDVALALLQALDGLDWVRAAYLCQIVYRVKEHRPCLSSFAQMKQEAQERISFLLGARYDALLHWLQAYQSEPPPLVLDLFFGRLFDELLGRPGYGFHRDYDAAAAAASLIESVLKFRQASDTQDPDELGTRYVRMVEGGVLAAQYLFHVQPPPVDAVFVGPAYTFLTENRPVSYQFWLNVNSPSWGRRLFQPLTHPFVLTRHWPRERPWTEEDEFRSGQEMLQRVVLGLLRRCRVKVYLGASELNPRGGEERGPLQEWLQRLMRDTRPASAPSLNPPGAEEGHV